ncbi:hypothetical protein GCM10009601_27560 [Streptomyces thermospinosisporus]|uniref:Uncharacterized protein n=1 Tax=Streptomyces thermospinosisporus TaxID=161482 RepID=A0ABN1YVQ8_9ACTN
MAHGPWERGKEPRRPGTGRRAPDDPVSALPAPVRTPKTLDPKPLDPKPLDPKRRTP